MMVVLITYNFYVSFWFSDFSGSSWSCISWFCIECSETKKVIDAMREYLSSNYSNIHRGAYDLSMESSILYDKAKQAVAKNFELVPMK